MKKLALILVSSTVLAGATNANINTGYYVGAHTGYGAVTAKASGVQAVAPGAGAGIPGSTDVGSSGPNIGIMAGYGWVASCMYYGGELAYTYENIKVSDTTGQGGNFGSSTFKRNGYLHAAFRGGYLFTPNTMLYVRLGTSWGQWKLSDTLNNGFSFTNPAQGTKTRLTFVPGLGIETAIHRHVYVRLEYVFEFASSVKATSSSAPLGSTTMSNVRSQSGKVGLAYKF